MSNNPSTSQANNKRIAKNTLLLYFRMAITMLVQLYTSRVVLQTLGVTDYGIYNVVGGIVSMFSFLNAAMTTSTQRYLTFELGRGNMQKLKEVFFTSVNIHLIIAIVITLLAETIGLWFFYNKMIIPPERLTAAFWVFQISILTTFIAIMSYPYNAAIIAHERMSAFAYISVAETVLKLLVVYLLLIGDFDKLILYAVLLGIVQLGIRFCYSNYCSRHFEETHYFRMLRQGSWRRREQVNDPKQPSLFKEMLAFAGWNVWGNLAAILFSQGLNLLLNMFFGPVVNAARAISTQVQSAIFLFSANFQTALNPQITKTYACGQFSEMHRLIYRSSKFTFILLFIPGLMVFLEAPTILRIWLGTVPDYTVIFLRITLIIMMIDATANPLMTAAAATGEVRKYQSIIGGILLSIVPISYLVLKCGGAPWSVFIVHLAVCVIAYVSRLFIIRPLIQLRIREFINHVVLRLLLIAVVSFVPVFLLQSVLPSSLSSSLVVLLASFLLSTCLSYFFGLDRQERHFIQSKAKSLIQKFQR